MPSPVIGSVAAAASPTKRARPKWSIALSMRAGMGHARWAASATALGPSTSRTWGRPKSSGQSSFMRRTGMPDERWMPKPTLARPPGSGNDHA